MLSVCLFVRLSATETWKRDGTFRYGNLVDELADLAALRNRDTDNNRGEEDEEDEIEEDEEEEEENEGSGENPTVNERPSKPPNKKHKKGKKGWKKEGKGPKGTHRKGERRKGKGRRNNRPFIRWDGSKDDPHGLRNDMIYDRMIHNDRRVEDRFIEDESM